MVPGMLDRLTFAKTELEVTSMELGVTVLGSLIHHGRSLSTVVCHAPFPSHLACFSLAE